jgi:hypothetical protein
MYVRTGARSRVGLFAPALRSDALARASAAIPHANAWLDSITSRSFLTFAGAKTSLRPLCLCAFVLRSSTE